MAILNEILTWTQTLPMWQRDAARQLFVKRNGLGVADYEAIYQFFKEESGLANPGVVTPQPLDQTHLPATITQGTSVSLNSLKDLKDVNKIQTGQSLDFADTGLTVVYGDNGAGKSGYARVMKQACRARDQADQILPNANDLTAATNIPSATFVVTSNGTQEEVTWTQDGDSPDQLSQIAVFDSDCARAYITKEHDVAYLPYGLDVVEGLANVVIPNVSDLLDTEINAIDTDPRAFDNLCGVTVVGKIFSSLSVNTDEAEIRRLGKFEEVDVNRLAVIKKVLNEANPLERARTLSTTVNRFKNTAIQLSNPAVWVKDSSIEKLKVLHQTKKDAEDSEAQLAAVLSSNETLLPATGGEVWRKLFEAARSYSIRIDKDQAYPSETQGSSCLLCQEPMPQAAIDRLGRFDSYVKNDIAKKADAARLALQAAIDKITTASLQINLDQSALDEFAEVDTQLPQQIHDYQQSIEDRRTWMLNAVTNDTWDNIPELAQSPKRVIRAIAARYLREARALVHSANEAQRAILEIEMSELEARKLLSNVVDPAIDLVHRIKQKAALTACKSKLDTRSISAKSKQFASAAVTQGLQQALDAEFKNLSVGHIKTKLKEKTVRGVMHHQLILDVPSGQKLEKVLSEGEQRGIAVAAFMAELSLANHSCGIIFDDPVSSLDHRRRKFVSKRLVQEGAKRQVLIFTHEIVFLQQLIDDCEKLNVDFKCSYLEHYQGKAGVISEGLPWMHKSVADRLDKISKKQREFHNRPWPDHPNDDEGSEVVRQYSHLRATIERYVQDVLLAGTVQRFRDYIQVDRLKKAVGIEQSEVDEILRLSQCCHDIVEAHDPASARNDPAPTPIELKTDIDAFQALIDRVKQRRKDSGIT